MTAAPDPLAPLLKAVADLKGSFSLTLGSVATDLKAVRSTLTRPPMQPVQQRIPRTGVVDATGAALVPLDGPQKGFYWYVRQIAVGGTDPSVVPNGIADIFVVPQQVAANLPAIGMAAWRDRASAMPLIGWYSAGDIQLVEGDVLVVLFTQATVGDTLTAVAQIEQHQLAALPQVVTS